MPDAHNTVAIIFGGWEWPNYPTLESSPALRFSAQRVKDYLTSARGLRLPIDNVKDLFDLELQPGQLLGQIRTFLTERLKNVSDLSNIIFYYCGHGGYLHETEYFLALRCSDSNSKEATIFKISYLVDVIRDLTREKRNLVILDACYSGGAIGAFSRLSGETDAADLVTRQLLDPLVIQVDAQNKITEEHRHTVESEGTVLFCAAGPKNWALTPYEGEDKPTMFSGALLETLWGGDKNSGPYISLNRLATLTFEKISKSFGSESVKPQIHVPVQYPGDVLNGPFFLNSAYDIFDFEGRLSSFELKLQDISAALMRLQPAATVSPGGADKQTTGNIRVPSPPPSFLAPKYERLLEDYSASRARGMQIASYSILSLMVILASFAVLETLKTISPRVLSGATGMTLMVIFLILILISIAYAAVKILAYMFSDREMPRLNTQFRSEEEYRSAIEVEPRLIDALGQDFLRLPVVGRVERRLTQFCLAIDAISITAGILMLFLLSDYIHFASSFDAISK